MVLAPLRNRRGATLIEQLVSLLLSSVIIVFLYGFFRAELFHLTTRELKTATLQDARGALDIIARDLKNAGSWARGRVPPEVGGNDDPRGDGDAVCNRIYAASRTLIHIQMDLNGNNTCADTDPRENVVYELTGPTSLCPGPTIIRRNGDCLIAEVTTNPAGRLFTYYDEAGQELGDHPSLAVIKVVKIAFSTETRHPDPKVGGKLSSTLSTRVHLRN